MDVQARVSVCERVSVCLLYSSIFIFSTCFCLVNDLSLDFRVVVFCFVF